MRSPTIFLLLIAIFSCQEASADPIRFDRDVRPILSDKCFFCHGPDAENRHADLRLDLEAEARAAIGTPEESELVARISSADPDDVMPPADSHKKLEESEIELLMRWVAEGGAWTEHWAFVPPAMSGQPNQPSKLIDQLISDKLKSIGLEPTGEAPLEKLIRRVTFDLTGMPPTLPEIDDFLADQSTNAFEKVVDRLLASPRYGQRMALM